MAEGSSHVGLRIGVWFLGILTALATLWCAFALWIVIASGSSPGPGEPRYGNGDPHGYAMVAGVLMLVLGLAGLLVVVPPWRALLRRLRGARRTDAS